MSHSYSTKLDPNDWLTYDIITVDKFKASVDAGLFIDYDGFGNPAKDGYYDPNFSVYPSQLETIPSDATHIIWYNR